MIQWSRQDGTSYGVLSSWTAGNNFFVGFKSVNNPMLSVPVSYHFYLLFKLLIYYPFCICKEKHSLMLLFSLKLQQLVCLVETVRLETETIPLRGVSCITLRNRVFYWETFSYISLGNQESLNNLKKSTMNQVK